MTLEFEPSVSMFSSSISDNYNRSIGFNRLKLPVELDNFVGKGSFELINGLFESGFLSCSSIEPVDEDSSSQAGKAGKDYLLKVSQISRDIEQIKSAVHTIKDILLYLAGAIIGVIVGYILILLVKLIETFEWPLRVISYFKSKKAN